jgi:ribonuclease E
MTRKRVGQGLLEAFSEPCEVCGGRGVIVHSEPVDEKKPAKVERFDDRPRSERSERGGRDRDRDKPRVEGSRSESGRGEPDKAPTAGADDGDAPAPKKRSRGGRGRGGRAEGAAGAAATQESEDPTIAEPDATPDLADQPPTAVEDQPVLPEITPDPEDDAAVDSIEVEPVDVSSAAVPAREAEGANGSAAAPKRRRRATSRPAGPPTVSV